MEVFHKLFYFEDSLNLDLIKYKLFKTGGTTNLVKFQLKKY